MKISIKPMVLLILLFLLLLTACTSTPAVDPTQIPTLAPTLAPTAPSLPTEVSQPTAQDTVPDGTLEREDAQGNVVVIVTPLNLDALGDTLDFDLVMDTHSVDLSMDLTSLADLTTDKGLTVKPLKWDAPLGGHHVSGTLSFPTTVDGSQLLDGASTLTLTIRNVDAPERTFTWQLNTN
ncbi:MAG: hypothetical protein ACYC6E_13050 [Bellilinea sp.]